MKVDKEVRKTVRRIKQLEAKAASTPHEPERESFRAKAAELRATLNKHYGYVLEEAPATTKSFILTNDRNAHKRGRRGRKSSFGKTQAVKPVSLGVADSVFEGGFATTPDDFVTKPVGRPRIHLSNAEKARWPLGTRERLAFILLVETGLRKSDMVGLGPQHVRPDGNIKLRTSKTGTEVVIPMSDEFRDMIAASPVGDMIFFTALNGSPMKPTSFGNWFGEACVAAGVPGRAHGLRKRRATDLSEAGWTTAQINATLGWVGDKMAAHYTRAANKDKLVKDAPKLRTSTSAPSNPVRALGQKDE